MPTTGDDAVSEDSVPDENLDENSYDNVVLDAADFEAQSNEAIDPAVGKSFVSDRTLRTSTLVYPFPETWPERTPPIRYNPFVHGISHLYDSGAGIWQSPYIPSFRESTGSEFSCSPKKFVGLMACGVGSTTRGRYQVIIERFQTDSLNWKTDHHFLCYSRRQEIFSAGCGYGKQRRRCDRKSKRGPGCRS